MNGRGNNKPNATGRSKTAPFVQVYYALMDSAAWSALTGNDIKLLLHLIRLSKGNNGYGHGGDDGRLYLAVRHAADVLHLAPGTIHKAFASLVDKGFVRSVQLGSFSVKVQVASTWRLTFQPTPWNQKPGTNEWRDWKPEQNPRCQKLNATVSKIDTPAPIPAEAVSEIDTVPTRARSAPPSMGVVSNIGTHLDMPWEGANGARADTFSTPSFDPLPAGGIFQAQAVAALGEVGGKLLASPAASVSRCKGEACDKPVTGGGRGKPKEYCSEPCRKRAEGRRRCERKKAVGG